MNVPMTGTTRVGSELRLSMTATVAPRAFDAEAIWRDLRRPLLAFITRRVSDADAAEDILQEIMLRIYRWGSDHTEPESTTAWLYGVARHAIIDHYRRAAARREQPAGTYLDLHPPESPPDEVPEQVRREVAGCLAPLVAQLPPKYRDAVQLTDLDGLTQAEAAARSGLSPSGMKSRVQRGRHQLRTMLEQCCEIALDPRGGIAEFSPRTQACDCR